MTSLLDHCRVATSEPTKSAKQKPKKSDFLEQREQSDACISYAESRQNCRKKSRKTPAFFVELGDKISNSKFINDFSKIVDFVISLNKKETRMV